LQIIGKDILQFHAIYFPTMLLALSLPLPKILLTHAHWTINQNKMSKSLGNVTDPIEAMNTFRVDGIWYYIARVDGRIQDDVDWSTEQADNHRRNQVQLLPLNNITRYPIQNITWPIRNLFFDLSTRRYNLRAQSSGFK